jgi:methionyl-tRNA formyltransferase
MQYKLDTGPILASQSIEIQSTDTTPLLRTRLTETACDLLPQTLEGIFNRSIVPLLQDESSATYCKKIKKEDGLISLSDDPTMLDRKFRAYTPWPGIYFTTMYKNKEIRVKVTKATFANRSFTVEEVVPENMRPMDYSVLANMLDRSVI